MSSTIKELLGIKFMDEIISIMIYAKSVITQCAITSFFIVLVEVDNQFYF